MNNKIVGLIWWLKKNNTSVLNHIFQNKLRSQTTSWDNDWICRVIPHTHTHTQGRVTLSSLGWVCHHQGVALNLGHASWFNCSPHLHCTLRTVKLLLRVGCSKGGMLRSLRMVCWLVPVALLGSAKSESSRRKHVERYASSEWCAATAHLRQTDFSSLYVHRGGKIKTKTFSLFFFEMQKVWKAGHIYVGLREPNHLISL